jgi:ADP-heptose:LPS heptosyltransferase
MDPRRILFIAEGQLGDLLLLTPTLRAVKETFSSVSISVLIVERRLTGRVASSLGQTAIQPLRGSSDSVLSTDPNVDEILVVDREALRSLRGLARIRAELEVVRFLSRKKYDAAVSTFPEDRFALWAFLSRAKVRVGQKSQGLSWLLTHKPEIEKQDRGVLQYYCELARAIGARVTSERTGYIVPEPSREWAAQVLHDNNLESANRLIVVHPGATGNYKIWPPDFYAAFVDILQSTIGTRVLLCRGLQDEAVVAEIRNRLHTEVVELDTGDNVGHLAGLLQRCDLCVSNDSGPRHLAVAVGTPSLALFRQFHDREWQVYPEGDRCAILRSNQLCPVCPPGTCLDKLPASKKFGSHCLRMVSVERAVAKVNEILAFQKSK